MFDPDNSSRIRTRIISQIPSPHIGSLKNERETIRICSNDNNVDDDDDADDGEM